MRERLRHPLRHAAVAAALGAACACASGPAAAADRRTCDGADVDAYRCVRLADAKPRRIANPDEIVGFRRCLAQRQLRLRLEPDRNQVPAWQVISPRVQGHARIALWDLPEFLEHERQGPGYSLVIHKNFSTMQAMSDPGLVSGAYPMSARQSAAWNAMREDIVWAFRECYRPTTPG